MNAPVADLSLDELFGSAGLVPVGPVPWGTRCDEPRPGVYVVVADGETVYIGRTRVSLARRLHQFYRHRYGRTSPHRGGQEVLMMTGERTVYWCPTDDPRGAEREMLRVFEDHYGRLPTANRKRGDRPLQGDSP